MHIGCDYRGNGSCCFTVWAPLREKVSLQVPGPDGGILPMRRDERGYWHAEAEEVRPGLRYLFRLDENVERPDPASHYQPEGVHGPSEIVDHASSAWQDGSWNGIALKDMIIYELHVGTFTREGTFDALLPRLDDLQSLGITALEIMPVAQFPGRRNWGYDGAYLYAVQNSYGGPAGLKRLVDACHLRGMAVILDVVYNHFGPEGNYIGEYGPYYSEKYTSPWGSALNFDDAWSEQVRSFFIENALFWFRHYHIDALRLDAVHGIIDMSAKHILQEMAEAVEDAFPGGRKRYLIAESDLNDSRVVSGRERGGYGIDAQWSDDFHHSLHALLTGERKGYYADFGTPAHLHKAYRHGFVYTWDYSLYRRRRHGSGTEGIPADRFIVCSQNHDQVGNRMCGERLSELADFESLKLAAGAVLTSPFVPLLFMGEEYAEDAPFLYVVDHNDPDLLEAVREGRKKEFQSFAWQAEPPDPASPETFLRSRLQWDKRATGRHKTMLALYARLIKLRRSSPALRNPDRESLDAALVDANGVITLHRRCGREAVLVILNVSAGKSTCALTAPPGTWVKILDSADRCWEGPGPMLPLELHGAHQCALPPRSIALYEKND